jgi:hypothetical protein
MANDRGLGLPFRPEQKGRCCSARSAEQTPERGTPETRGNPAVPRGTVPGTEAPFVPRSAPLPL